MINDKHFGVNKKNGEWEYLGKPKKKEVAKKMGKKELTWKERLSMTPGTQPPTKSQRKANIK